MVRSRDLGFTLDSANRAFDSVFERRSLTLTISLKTTYRVVSRGSPDFAGGSTRSSKNPIFSLRNISYLIVSTDCRGHNSSYARPVNVIPKAAVRIILYFLIVCYPNRISIMNPTHTDSRFDFLRRSFTIIAVFLTISVFVLGLAVWNALASRGMNESAQPVMASTHNPSETKNLFRSKSQSKRNAWGGWEAPADFYTTLLNGSWRTPSLPAPLAAVFGCSGASPNIVCTSSGGVIGLNSSGVLTPASVYPSSNVVSGLSGTTSSVAVRLNGLNHDWGYDLQTVLVRPAGSLSCS